MNIKNKIKKIIAGTTAILISAMSVSANGNNTSAVDNLINTLTAWLPYLLIFALVIIALLVVARMFKDKKE